MRTGMRFVAILVLVVGVGASLPVVAGKRSSKVIVIPPGADRAYDDYHYAPAVRVGDTVIVSGIPAAGADSYEGKVRNMFERTRRVLAEAGAVMEDVVDITTFHAEARDTAGFREEFARFLAIHREYFTEGYPAWTAVGTSALLAEGAVVEMRVVAVVGAGKKITVQRADD